MIKNLISFITKNRYIIIIFIVGLSLRLFPFRESFYWDEAVYLQNAETFLGASNYSELDFRPPLLSLLIALSYSIYHSFITAKIVTSILACSSIIGIYLVGKEIFDEKIAITASIILAILPFSILNSQLIMTDNPAMSFSIFAVYFFIMSLKTGKAHYIILSAVFSAFAFLTRFPAAIIAPVLLSYYAYHFRKSLVSNLLKIIKAPLIYIFTFAIFLLPYFVWVRLKFGSFLYTLHMGSLIISWSPSVDTLYYLLNIYEILPTLFLAIMIIGIFIHHYTRKDNGFMVLLYLWFILPFTYLTYVPHKELRYLTQILPPLILLLSYGTWLTINSLYKNVLTRSTRFASLYSRLKQIVPRRRRRRRRRLIALSLILAALLFIFAIPGYFPYYKITTYSDYKTDSVIVSGYIKDNLTDGYVVYANFDYPVIALYSGKDIELIQRDFPKNAKRSYLVHYPQIENWIHLNMTKVNEKYEYVNTVEGIDIYRYDG